MLYAETRVDELTRLARAARTSDRRRILAVRIGATDLCALYGLRRAPDLTVYDVQVVAGVIADVVNVLGRADGTGFTVTGPVWEYFGGARADVQAAAAASRRSTEHDGRELRGELIARDIDGLIREVALDQANGLIGKTVIHPTHVAVVHALSVVIARGVQRRAGHPAPPGARRRAALRVPQQDERGQPAPGLGAAHAAARARCSGSRPRTSRFVDLLVRGVMPAEPPSSPARGRSVRAPSERGRRSAACCSGSRCGATRGARTCWCRGCSASTCPPTRGWSTPPGCCSARWSPTHWPARPPRALPVDLLHAAVPGRARRRGGVARDGAARRSRPDAVDAVVLGFAETATGARALRRRRPSAAPTTCTPPAARCRASPPAGGFEEEHSHATAHLLLPADPALLAGPRPLVLVDDELSTGHTVLNTIRRCTGRAARALRAWPAGRPPRHALAGLPDGVGWTSWRSRATSAPRDLASVVAPCAPSWVDAAARPAPSAPRPAVAAPRRRIACATRAAVPPAAPQPDAARAARVRAAWTSGWPAGLPEGGRHGFTAAAPRGAGRRAPRLAADLAGAADVRAGERTLVLGTEELMSAPLRLAAALADAGPRRPVLHHHPLPVLVVDDPGYAIRSRLAFPAHDDPADGPGPRFAYNVGRRRRPTWSCRRRPARPTPPRLRTGLCSPALRPAHPAHRPLVVTP